jgi:hypothetical protein
MSASGVAGCRRCAFTRRHPLAASMMCSPQMRQTGSPRAIRAHREHRCRRLFPSSSSSSAYVNTRAPQPQTRRGLTVVVVLDITGEINATSSARGRFRTQVQTGDHSCGWPRTGRVNSVRSRRNHLGLVRTGVRSCSPGCCKLIFGPPEKSESCTVSTPPLDVPGGTSNDTTA